MLYSQRPVNYNRGLSRHTIESTVFERQTIKIHTIQRQCRENKTDPDIFYLKSVAIDVKMPYLLASMVLLISCFALKYRK